MGQMIVTYNDREEKGQLINFLEGNGFCNIQHLKESENPENFAQAICVDIQSWIFFGVISGSTPEKRGTRRDVWTVKQFLDNCA